MSDIEQAAIDALRAAGLEDEACAVEILRARQKATIDAFEAGQRASYGRGWDECMEVWAAHMRGMAHAVNKMGRP